MIVKWRHGTSRFNHSNYVVISLEWKRYYKHWIFPLFHEMMHALPMKFRLHELSELLYITLNNLNDKTWLFLWDKVIEGNWKCKI